ncbi:MAG: arsenite methyltransferase [Phycisphaerales bacterium]
MTDSNTHNTARTAVREGYAQIAKTGQFSGVQASGCCGGSESSAGGSGGGGCCGPTTLTTDDVAAAVGYAREDLETLPDGANMGLSCGNPTAIAALREGETVLDLGSGGGFDCFLAGPKIGATGRVIGVDMTPDMLDLARKNIASYTKHSGLENVEFRLGEIEHLPVADASVDVVISNCVINLSPEKQRVWDEIARVLKPGGRVAVSDLALLKPLPAQVRTDIEALVGCVAGAELVTTTEQQLAHAGLTSLDITLKPEYVAAFENAKDPLYKRIAQSLPKGESIADYVTSMNLEARKPAEACCGTGCC